MQHAGGWLIALCLVLLPFESNAQIEAEHPSDYVRVLEAGDPELWSEAASGLLGDKGRLPLHSVSSVIRRLDAFDSPLRSRLAQALQHNPRHPGTARVLLQLSRDPDPAVQEAALESLLTLRSPSAIDVFQELVLEGGPHRLEAFRALEKAYNRWAEDRNAPYSGAGPHPFADNGAATPEQVFDQRYLPAVQAMLSTADLEVRREAIEIAAAMNTPAVREELVRLTEDTDPEIQYKARWELAKLGDSRPCPALFEQAEAAASNRSAEDSSDYWIGSLGSACAPTYFLDYLRWYTETKDEVRRTLFREMIEEAADITLLEQPRIVDGLRPLAEAPDDFVRETAVRILSWEANAQSEERAETIRSGIRPLFLMALAVVAAVAGTLLFIWAWHLYALAVRVRHQPVSTVRAMAMGPVALEGEVQPAGSYLQHPVTGEPCLYYVGADSEHPNAKFYLVDDTGRVLVDPQKAVLFSDDGVLVAGERVHLMGYAAPVRSGRDSSGTVVVVKKNPMTPSAYRKFVHRVIELLFGFGRQTGVTKMLFSDPGRCFWIWDDLERRPMAETHDIVWLAAGVLLGGAWSVVFAVAVLGLIDQDMSATLANALGAAKLETGSIFGAWFR